jgi:hypothetical protein
MGADETSESYVPVEYLLNGGDSVRKPYLPS